MSVPSVLLAKAAAIVLSGDKGRKAIGWIMVAILSPLILIATFLCSAASGGADHNNLAVEASFYGTSYTEEIVAAPDTVQVNVIDIMEALKQSLAKVKKDG